MLVKNELSGIPLLPVPECNDKHAQVICPVWLVELPRSGTVLVVDYYESGAQYPAELSARFFSDGNRWLTVREWPAKIWTTQQPVSWIRTWRFGPEAAWSPETDAQLAMKFLPTKDTFHAPAAAHNAAYVVENFIDLRRQEANERSAENMKRLQEYHFALYPKLPDDLPAFMDERVFTDAYTFIGKAKMGVRTARCSHCGNTYEVHAAVKHRQNTTCPRCGRYSKFIEARFNPQNLVDVATVAVNHKVAGDLLIRWTTVTRTMSAPDYTPSFKYEDIGYNLHLHEKGREKLYCYLKMSMPYMKGKHWKRRPMGEPVIIPSHIYTRNLTEVFGRFHYNVDLADAFRGPSSPVAWHSILNGLRNDPTAEYLLKMRMPAMVGWLPRSKSSGLARASSLLNIDPNLVPLCREYNITPHELCLLRDYGRPISRRDFEMLRRMGRIDSEKAKKALKQMTFTKFVNYFTNQPGRRGVNTLIQEWLDYIDMATTLGLDLSRKSTRYPKDIHAAHNGILSAFYAHQEAAENAKFEAACSDVYAKLPFLEFRHGAFLACLPSSRSALTAEGKSLHHCVGLDRYFKTHIAGKCLIVFIRKAATPDKPYVTMELRMEDFQIMQIHGYGDRPATPSELAFARRYVQELKAAMTAGKETVA